MANTCEEYPPRKESSSMRDSSEKAYPSSSNYPQGPQPPPPPGFVGYPPQNMGYPGYPPNYSPYPQNAYQQQPPGAYYAVPPPYHTSSSRGFLRCLIFCSLLILVTFFFASFVVWSALLPQAPAFRVEKLSVSNFSTSRSVFVVQFDIDLSIENSDNDLKVYFQNFNQAIYHNNDIVSLSSSPPVALDTKERRVVNIKMSTGTANEALVGRWAVDALEKDRASGLVTFILRLRITTAFRSGRTMWTETAELRVLCDDLTVKFTGDSGDGNLDTFDGKPKICEVSI